MSITRGNFLIMLQLQAAIYFLCFRLRFREKKKISQNINHSVIPALHPKIVSQQCERLKDDNTSRERRKSIYFQVVLGVSRPGRRFNAGSGERGGGADGFQAENNKRSHFCNHVVPINTHCLLIKCLYDQARSGLSLHTTGFSQRTKPRQKRLFPSFSLFFPASPSPLLYSTRGK